MDGWSGLNCYIMMHDNDTGSPRKTLVETYSCPELCLGDVCDVGCRIRENWYRQCSPLMRIPSGLALLNHILDNSLIQNSSKQITL